MVYYYKSYYTLQSDYFLMQYLWYRYRNCIGVHILGIFQLIFKNIHYFIVFDDYYNFIKYYKERKKQILISSSLS